MQIQAVNRTDADKVYVNFTNKSGATLTLGYAVALTTLAASLDGNQAISPAANSSKSFIGIAASDVANNAVGKAQAYGYVASVYFMAEATSVSLAAGLHGAGPAVANSYGVGPTGFTTAFGPVLLVASIGAVVRSAGGYTQGFIRNL